MNECMVNEQGEILEILQTDREPIEGEFKVILVGYYEVLNEQRYPKAIYNFQTKAWVGVGEPRPMPIIESSELDKLKADVDYLLLINGGE